MTTNSPKIIQSVQRAIDILNCFSKTRPELSINEISSRTGLNVNTARGLINTLIANGLVVKEHGSNLYHLGNFFLCKAGIIQEQIRSYILMGKPLMDALAEKYHTTASLQIVNQDEIITIYCAYPVTTTYYIKLTEYTSLPPYVTSSGKLMLAFDLLPANPGYLDKLELKRYTPYSICDRAVLSEQLAEIRKLGYSWEKEEFNVDVGSIAVPVFGYADQFVGTVSVTMFAKAFPPIAKILVAELKDIADKISVLMGQAE